MLDKQQSFSASPYTALYDILIPKDHLLRQIQELVDFSFVEKELKDNYCIDNGRYAVSPIRMFKYLLLKVIYDMSDRTLIERVRFDMSFKFFLEMTPEEEPIHPSSLTKFRRQRLKNVCLLNLLIKKTTEIAIETGVLKSNTLIMDATHTVSKYNSQTPLEILRERSKQLRKAVYQVKEEMKQIFPAKNTTKDYNAEVDYCNKLITIIKQTPMLETFPAINEKLDFLEETLHDTIHQIQSSNDEDAKTGHKTVDTSFFGYKTHIAMSEDRIITAAIVTSGEKGDGQYLQELLEQSIENGMKVTEILADTAYSGKTNLEICKEKQIRLISKLHPTIHHKNNRNSSHFTYNKDGGMYVCPAGHMAIRKKSSKATKTENPRIEYIFDIEKCKNCPKREGCYKGTKKKSFTVTILSEVHNEQSEVQKTEEFRNKYRERYRIEAKNGELKNQHGYNKTHSSGIEGMWIQGATTLFCVNLKRIIKQLNEKA